MLIWLSNLGMGGGSVGPAFAPGPSISVALTADVFGGPHKSVRIAADVFGAGISVATTTDTFGGPLKSVRL